MTLPDIPAAVAIVTAIFGIGIGLVVGWATRIRPEPEAEPDHETTIEQRARKAHD
jgi:hypothetical protein